MKLVSLTANFATFRPIQFRDGMNIIVANRTKEATQTDSRNGLGKTTSLALIDFCLGANSSDRIEQMKGKNWEFTLSIETKGGHVLQVTRSPDSTGEITVQGDVRAAGLVQDSKESEQDEVTIGLRRWTQWLGERTFEGHGLPAKSPSFRALLKHVFRYRNAAFLGPFQTMSNQRAKEAQVENAYFLNLDWRLAEQWAELKEKKNRIAAIDTQEESVEEQIAAIEPQIIRLRRRAERLKNDIQSFSVVPEYRDLERRVNDNSKKIKKLANANLVDEQQLGMYEERLQDAFTSDSSRVQQLFAEAGLHLREAVVRTLDEAIVFHRQVEENRVAYLEEEVRRIRERIERRSLEQERISARNQADLQLLNSGGALDDFSTMQQQLAATQAEIEDLSLKVSNLRELSARKDQLKSDELNLKSRTDRDLQERLARREPIIARFGEIMDTFLDEPADIQVLRGGNGFQFKTNLPRTGSSGVDRMAIFAYDVAVSENLVAHGRSPGILVHDSAIFADVDERQTAQMLEIGAHSSSTNGYQYVLAINSDTVPWSELSDRSLFDEAVVLELHDGDAKGSLLGVRLANDADHS